MATTRVVRLPELTYEDISKQGNLDDIIAQLYTLKTRFPSEKNENTYDYACKVLTDYVHVPNTNILWVGRYARYLDCQEPFALHLKLGGYVVKDNSFTVTLRNKDKIFNVQKRNRLWFLLPTASDIERVQMGRLV